MVYKGENLRAISFPLGGIGTGSIGLAGNGGFCDWEVFNRPNKGGMNGYTHISIRAQFKDGSAVTKVLQGDSVQNFMGERLKDRNHDGFGYGPRKETMSGFPHFSDVEFDGRFPIAALTFRDEQFPGKVVLTAFNPFVPLNADASGIPAAFFEIAIENGEADVQYTVAFSVCNPFGETENTVLDAEYPAIFLKHASAAADDVAYGDMTLACDHSDMFLQPCWYRGGWMDGITTFWREMTRGTFCERTYDTPGKGDTCTLGYTVRLKAGECDRGRFALSWNVPNNYNYWRPCKDENERDVTWKNYYATLFENSAASAFHALHNWNELYAKTVKFRDALHGSTLDPAVIDAASSTLSVLKSPTVLRLSDGSFYGWEGTQEHVGSCEGTCTHVWGYAYALCFLFPDLERSIRNVKFAHDVSPDGRMVFRTDLPLQKGEVISAKRGNVAGACLDGQMATVIQMYRDWKLSGDDAWLRGHWDTVKSLIAYVWSEENPHAWDRDKDGVLEGRQHHTLDMELFGPSSWLQGMYSAALRAASEMAAYLGDTEAKEQYDALFESGYTFTKENLFNGSYFIQKVDIEDKTYTDRFACSDYWNAEACELKYQIGEGSSIDQMLGQWHATLCGLGDIFDPAQRKTALESMWENNFKSSLREFANPWRVFALEDEGGSIICTYPDGARKPAIPVPYCEECMTGFEYAFAGLLISEGYIEEGLTAVRAVRDRYDGKKRNPWNEIECGSNYARAMASFALLPIFSGFAFDLPHGTVGFTPKIKGDFRCLWSLGTGWGEFEVRGGSHTVRLLDGALTLSRVTLGNAGEICRVTADGQPVDFKQESTTVSFDRLTVKSELVFEEAI